LHFIALYGSSEKKNVIFSVIYDKDPFSHDTTKWNEFFEPKVGLGKWNLYIDQQLWETALSRVLICLTDILLPTYKIPPGSSPGFQSHGSPSHPDSKIFHLPFTLPLNLCGYYKG
jgi:hypothetical protein